MQNKLFLVALSFLLSQNSPSNSDPEDYTTDVDEVSQISFEQNNCRIRVQPEDIDEKWYYLQILKFNRIIAGWRIDKIAEEKEFSNKKFSFSWINPKSKFLLGNVKVELGQGHLFSSKYGRIKSYENSIQIAKQKQIINIDLSSYSNDDMYGAYYQYHIKSSFISDFIITNQLKFASLRWKNTPFDLRLTTVSMNKNLSTSLVNEFSFGNIILNSEIVFQSPGMSFIMNGYIDKPTFKWLIQKRVLSSNHANMFGKPYTTLGGKNEKGLLIAYYLKTNKIIWSGWLDVYSQMQNYESQPLLRGSDYYFGVKYNFNSNHLLELRLRTKNNLESTIITENDLENQYWEIIKKNKISVKYKNPRTSTTLQYNTITSKLRKNEKGLLVGFSMDVYETSQKKFIGGFNVYKTDSWDSRMYIYEPGLKGEFRIRSFYDKGYSIFSKFIWNPSPVIFLSARISLDHASHNQTYFQQNVAVQMDIVF